MNDIFIKVFERLDEITVELFLEIDTIVHECTPYKVSVKLWQNSPLYYLSDDKDFKPFSGSTHNKSLHILPFKGHVNIYAPESLPKYYDKLPGYKITPKSGMLQIYCGQIVPKDILITIFREELT